MATNGTPVDGQGRQDRIALDLPPGLVDPDPARREGIRSLVEQLVNKAVKQNNEWLVEQGWLRAPAKAAADCPCGGLCECH